MLRVGRTAATWRAALAAWSEVSCQFRQRKKALQTRAIRSERVTPSLPAMQHRQQEMRLAGLFKPSDGLEPSTPSLPGVVS
jgi:hypothetical protein